MKKFLAFILSLISIFTFASCSSQEKYEFQYAFFPIEIIQSEEETTQVLNPYEIDETYISRVNTLFVSLTSFINEKFDLNISKPSPKVMAYSPDWGAAGSYLDGALYIDLSKPVSDDVIIHELIHYLSDNDNSGFIHTVKHQNSEISVGRGLTEGYTDMLTVMYCLENNISLPENVLTSMDMYSDNRTIAKAYFMLEEKTATWFFNGDYQSMTNFVLTNINAVANIPKEYSDNNTFDLFFHIYQDYLLEYGIGIREDISGFRLMYTASYEIASITIRGCSNQKLKEQIYSDIFSSQDQDNVLKDMILG